MKGFGIFLMVVGIVAVVGAFIWHITIGISAGNPLTPANSSPSSLAVFANSVLLISIGFILLSKK